MPRDDYDDRDEPDYDDRPRRRRRESSGDRSVWIILGVVGGVVLLVIAGCAGLVVWGVQKAGQAVQQVTQQVGGTMAAEAFCEDLRANQGNAYNSTSKGYQAGHTRAQFDQLLAQHPELTGHQSRTMVSFNMVGQDPNQQVVVKLRLHPQPATGLETTDDADEDDPPAATRPKKRTTPTAKGKDKTPPALKDLDVTLTLVNEGGVWKVDQITIP